MFEKLEKLKHDLYVGEQKLRAAENEGKALQREMKKLNRAERTHRLCTRAGMLEAFLEKPEQLTNDQVMELLKVAFRQPEVIQTLKEILKSEGVIKDPLEQRAHFYTGTSPVCALCEADSPDEESPGCFASRLSEQGVPPAMSSPQNGKRKKTVRPSGYTVFWNK